MDLGYVHQSRVIFLAFLKSSDFNHLFNFPENTSEHTRLRVDEVTVGTALPVM